MLLTLIIYSTNAQSLSHSLFPPVEPSLPLATPYCESICWASATTETMLRLVVLTKVQMVALLRDVIVREGRRTALMYTDDLPYVASALMIPALAQLLQRCGKAEIVETIEVHCAALFSNSSVKWVRAFWEPLGFQVQVEPNDLGVTLRGASSLRALLENLILWLAAQDSTKFHWLTTEQQEWLRQLATVRLTGHPSASLWIELLCDPHAARRFLPKSTWAEDVTPQEIETETETNLSAMPTPLASQSQRQECFTFITDLLRQARVRRVLDLGCGAGHFLSLLRKVPNITEIIAVDASPRLLRRAQQRLAQRPTAPQRGAQVRFRQGSLGHYDEQWRGYDAAILLQVLERTARHRLHAITQNVFGALQLPLVLVAVPHRSCQPQYESRSWDTEEFQAWAEATANRYSYHIALRNLGASERCAVGHTLLACFLRHASDNTVLPDTTGNEALLPAALFRGPKAIQTKLYPTVPIDVQQAENAVETLARFTVNPRWLIYLPPAMAAAEPSAHAAFLEYPDQAFRYYQQERMDRVLMQRKHMGSRVVVIVCRDERTAQRRFGIEPDEFDETGLGCVYTRTGRRFFDQLELEVAFLQALRDTLTRTGFWQRCRTDWVCLDGEMMPWSVKAQGLIEGHYRPTATAALAAIAEARSEMTTLTSGENTDKWRAWAESTQHCATQYQATFARYCWPVHSAQDLRFAPFHLLAAEGRVFAKQSHLWHLQTLEQFLGKDNTLFTSTPFQPVVLADSTARQHSERWFEELTEAGAEGVVIKPWSFLAQGRRGLAQPALKCRGQEHLHLVYGPTYDEAQSLALLRDRGDSAERRRKHRRAVREFALGLEALQRFVTRQPLAQVQECIFGILALESGAHSHRSNHHHSE